MIDSKKVLVVEDDPVLRMLTGKQLQQLGYSYEAVGSGEEAIKVLSSTEFAVVFMDIGLPGMDGIENTLAIGIVSILVEI